MADVSVVSRSECEERPLVPARMLNEWAYCPRLAALEWVHGEWADSDDTTEGHRAHAKADTARAPALPEPEALGDRAMKSRRLLLGSPALGMTAKIDLLETEDGVVTPVDIKKGKRPHIEHNARLPERVQVAAQVLLLRDAGYRCDRGALWFAGSRERVDVIVDDELEQLTLDGAEGLLAVTEHGVLPEPLVDSPKCTRCSLRAICLPDEVNWFRGGGVAATPPPAMKPSRPLYVQLPGAWIGKEGEVLRIGRDRETLKEIALAEVSDVVLAGRISLSTPAVHELLRRDIPISWMSGGFWFLGSTGGQGPKSARVRTAQYRAADSSDRRLVFARGLLAAKVRNQRTMLRRGWRGDEDAKATALTALGRLIKRIEAETDTDRMRGYEGDAAATYFRAIPSLFTKSVSSLPEFDFERRNRRPPADPVNACLSFGYALLTSTWTAALTTVGLDPWKGLWHAERPGRPSLSLDMIEPYRPILADSAVLTALNNGELNPRDFVFSGGGCNLSDDGRRTLIAVYERRLDQETTHPVFGYSVSMRRLLQVQARLLARWLLDEIPSYPHYVPR